MQTAFCWARDMRAEEKEGIIPIIFFPFHGTSWVIKIHPILMAMAERTPLSARGIILVCSRGGVGGDE